MYLSLINNFLTLLSKKSKLQNFGKLQFIDWKCILEKCFAQKGQWFKLSYLDWERKNKGNKHTTLRHSPTEAAAPWNGMHIHNICIMMPTYWKFWSSTTFVSYFRFYSCFVRVLRVPRRILGILWVYKCTNAQFLGILWVHPPRKWHPSISTTMYNDAPLLKTLKLHNFCLLLQIFLIFCMYTWGAQKCPIIW